MRLITKVRKRKVHIYYLLFIRLFFCTSDHDADIESERGLPRAERVASMKKRIHYINEYTKSLEYLVRFCPYPICVFAHLQVYF